MVTPKIRAKTYILEESDTDKAKEKGLFFLWDADYKTCLGILWIPDFEERLNNRRKEKEHATKKEASTD